MSVQKTSDGTWVVRWREHDRQRGRRFRLKKDAEAFDAELKRRRQLGPLAVEQLTTPGLTLNEWMVRRWAPEHAATLEQSTRDRYANVYARHIAPALGGVPLGELTVARVREWQAALSEAGVSPGTIQKARTLLSSVLRHAAESEAIAGNPVPLVRAPKAGHRDAVTPLAPVTVERLRLILAGPMDVEVPARTRRGVRVAGYVVADERDQGERLLDAAIVSILAYSGLRAGELRGLRWGDVRAKTLTVERSADGGGRAKATKTRNRRAVRLLAPLAHDLRELRIALGRPTDEVPILGRHGRA